MWSKLRNLEYRDLFWLLLGSVMGQHLVRAINHYAMSIIPAN